MNQIRAIQALNKREIENGVPPEASWHADYRDTAFVYFGGLPYELTEGDVLTIFSQFGEPVFLKLVRDKETGKSKGFGWLKYEDQRSTDLAVDNLGGADIAGRMVRVDHARYKLRDDEDIEECHVGWEDMLRRERAEKGLPEEDETDEESDAPRARPMLKEERELQLLLENHDDDDPMKEYLVDEKKKEVEEALRREKRRSEKRSRKSRDEERESHHHHRSRRSMRNGSEDEDEGRPGDKDKYRNREGRDRRDNERRRSPGRDRSRDRHRRDDRGGDHDSQERDRDRHRRHSPDRGERRHREPEDRRRRDRDRSRSRSPRRRRD